MSPEPDRGGRLAGLAAAVGLAVLAVCLVEFAALQYAMPPDFAARLGLNTRGVGHQRRVLGLDLAPVLGDAGFRDAFRAVVVGCWVGYATALIAALAGWRPPPARRMLPAISAAAFLMAVWCPASLSTDVYAYVAYARMAPVHGLNPYTSTPSQLIRVHDPTAPFVGYLDIPCVYGPVWLLGTSLGAELLRPAGLWWQVLALKLLAGASLVVAALAARHLAESWAPGRGDLALLAVGLNPLLLIEGPGNGHNDLLMMALVLGSEVLRGRRRGADLALGLAIGVKFVPIALLPWTLLATWRGRAEHRARAVAASLALALLPTIAAYGPFWRGAETFTAQFRRAEWGGQANPPSEAARWLTEQGLPRAGSALDLALARWPAPAAFLALSAWLAFRPPSSADRLESWGLLSLALIGWAAGIAFPWYLSWPLMASLARWGRAGPLVSTVGMGWGLDLYLRGYCR